VPFTDPYKPQDQIEQVRKVGRLAQIILDMRAEYERRPRPETLGQIVARIAELDGVRAEIVAHMTAAAAAERPNHPASEPNGSQPPADPE
jgi:hypothetical protein